MHVLVTTDTLGGVWTYTRELVTGLANRDITVTLVSFGEIPTTDQTSWLNSQPRVDFRPTAFRLEWMQDSEDDLAASAEYLLSIIAETKLQANEGWIMGGTGTPVPDEAYLNSVESLYLTQFSNFSFQGLTTPEQFCPIVCSPSEPDLGFGESVNQGASDLDHVIVPALQGGNNVAVLGYSQSATVATVEMNDLLNNTPAGVNLSDLHFTLLGDPNSPIGGILAKLIRVRRCSSLDINAVSAINSKPAAASY